MSSRPIFTPVAVINNGDMSSNIISLITIISNLSMMSYSYVWSGASPVGSIDVEISNDYQQNADGSIRNPGTWTALSLSSPTLVSGNTGTGFIDIDQLGAYAVRTTYTATSGTGTLNVIYKAKVS